MANSEFWLPERVFGHDAADMGECRERQGLSSSTRDVPFMLSPLQGKGMKGALVSLYSEPGRNRLSVEWGGKNIGSEAQPGSVILTISSDIVFFFVTMTWIKRNSEEGKVYFSLQVRFHHGGNSR